MALNLHRLQRPAEQQSPSALDLRQEQHCGPLEKTVTANHSRIKFCSHYINRNRFSTEVVRIECSGWLSRAIGTTGLRALLFPFIAPIHQLIMSGPARVWP